MTATENPWAVYDAMEIPHLQRFLDEGADFVSLDLTDEDVLNYAVNAAMAWHAPPIVVRGGEAREQMAHLFFDLVAKCSCIDDASEAALTFHDDGTVTVLSPLGEELEVTDRTMRHWQWMFMLFASQDLADRFLAEVPDRIRDEAMARATSLEKAEHATFLEIAFQEDEGDRSP